MAKQDTIASIESAINANSLQALETIIQKYRDKDPLADKSEEMKRLISLCILAFAGQTVKDNDVESSALRVLDDKEGVEQRKLIVACLLRLLPESNTQWISDPPWRPKVAALFDLELQDVYRERKIDPHLMGHQKIERLAIVVKEFEQDFLKALSMLTSLDRIQAQRHKLMRALASKPAHHFIVPFLPDNYGAQLGEAYKRAEVYLSKRDDLGIVDILAATKEELQEIVQQFEANGTIYGRWLGKNVGERLLALIEQDFATNAAAQPADVCIETRDSKKYPFHLVGQTINLVFVIKNQGPGYSYDTKLSLLSDDSLKLSTEDVQIGRLAPTTAQLVEIPAEALRAEPSADILVQVDWRNFDNTPHSANFTFVAHAQRSDIDWGRLEQSDPYSLEPVTTENDLVGRRDLLNRLLATLKAVSVGSAIIRGQKRVGKTSLAKTIQSHLQKEGYIAVYLESGDYVEASPAATVARLGNRLCKEMINRESRIAYISPPKFEDALSPLAEFLDDVIKMTTDRRVVFILDEFDELPLDLYARGAIGDSFFLTLRSISSRPNIGFILVGSEKITHVMDCQGDKLNKWNVVPVDYFTRESDWTDYRELVQRPVGDALEYTDGAMFALHDITAGNPYFTKLVCQRIFRVAVSKRDCHVTRTEITQAIETANRETDRNTFQHFWEDGIFERGPRAAEKSIRRRKILIAISDVLSSQTPASKTKIAEHPLVRNMAALDSDLKEFVTRKILISNVQADTYDFKVPLFSKWLKGRGIEDVIATFSDLDAALRERQQEEEIKVNAEEIQAVINQWGMYKGQAITEDKVRAWLEQFGGFREQRTMFTLLSELRFYSHMFIRRKMAEIHDAVKRGTIHHIESGKFKRSDILVSYLDNPAKSGSHIARLYVEEASIYVGNVVEKGKLKETLRESENTQALLFLDDFVGTGKSAADYLKEIDAAIADTVRERNIKVVFAAVVAFIEGWKHLEKTVENLSIPIQLHVCEILDETAKCFGENSSIFLDLSQREFAKEIALTYGKLLEKNCPLGFGNLEMAVVFERGCPNNSLPILWSESTSPKWIPLFKRL